MLSNQNVNASLTTIKTMKLKNAKLVVKGVRDVKKIRINVLNVQKIFSNCQNAQFA
jgi:uncharacterized Zn ribbon protein